MTDTRLKEEQQKFRKIKMTKNNHSKPTGAGKSSFDLIDVDAFYREINLKKAITFLDVACGRGAYCLKASEIIGSAGTVYGVDLWQEGIEQLKASAVEQNALNIEAFVSDAGRHIPLDDEVVDVCLMATVLHDFVADKISKDVLHEIVRVMKTDSLLAIVEFKKIDGPPGPPVHIRLSPEEVDDMLSPYGFAKVKLTEVGPSNYLMLFHNSGSS
jgi:ubiquinone/menaquinone biosynthesis C-methylase UbiE